MGYCTRWVKECENLYLTARGRYTAGFAQPYTHLIAPQGKESKSVVLAGIKEMVLKELECIVRTGVCWRVGAREGGHISDWMRQGESRRAK